MDSLTEEETTSAETHVTTQRLVLPNGCSTSTEHVLLVQQENEALMDDQLRQEGDI